MRHASVFVALCLAASGCAPHGYVVERVTAGVHRRGTWVPPSGYEHFVRAELLRAEGQHRAAIREYELARTGVVDSYLLAREVDAALAAGDAALADTLLREGLSLDARSEALWMVAGRLAESREAFEEAEQAFTRAREAAPRSDSPVLALADLLGRRGRDAEALALLDRFVSESPPSASPRDVPTLRVVLARALRAGDVRAASRAALRLVRIAPSHSIDVRTALERTLESSSLGGSHDESLEARVRVAAAVLELLPAEGESLADEDLRFRVSLLRGDRAGAERLALRADDGTVDGRLRSAGRWRELGEGARVEELARGLLLGADGPARAHVLLAEALLLQGRERDALQIVETMPTGTSEEDARRALLAELLRRSGLAGLADELNRTLDSARPAVSL